ncbi:MAG: DUF4235 domain-containing protein [Nocardioides sp.]
MSRAHLRRTLEDKPMPSKMWSAFSAIIALVTAKVARKSVSTSWRAATGKKPPGNPGDPDVAITEAVLWAAVSAMVVAVAKVLAARRAARYVARSTGRPRD